jgi:Domain of unknown function (DUF4411)
MTIDGPLYSFDTSALIDGLERYYPIGSFPGLWQQIDALVGDGRLVLSEEVWEEVHKKDAVAADWCDGHGKESLVIPTDAVIVQEVQSILQQNSRMVMNMKGRNRADPFVIAVARVRSATVVTGEANDGTANRPKIPYICQQYAIPCQRLLEVIQSEGWRF